MKAKSTIGCNPFDIELQTIRSGYDRKTCWTHARAGIIPGDNLQQDRQCRALRVELGELRSRL